TSLPFTTNLNLGNGYTFFIAGGKVSELDWNIRSVADILPTYRWIMDHEGKYDLTASIDYAHGHDGGNDINFRGNMEADEASTIQLYKANLPIEKDLVFTTTAKATEETELNLVITLDNGDEETIEPDQAITDAWTTVNYDLSS